ncbi:hypothetical protein [Roseomonas haemaphysalidis]|uniref:Uncharacterized protein n=1 Tax=Roseomonas haemaphysalidis TaxID=2768162 RepID=A0ABS3KVY4_9PROT|nr:hypothetical protein [Roseomonas haemaphysalidis]MBO1081643.1 hypothetical protein [Roseomonas haemaphysalidis]
MTASFDAAQAEAVRQQVKAAFAPHRCWVTLTEEGQLDFEVMTLIGDPIVALSRAPLGPLDALPELLAQAKAVGRGIGYSFSTP